MLLCEQESIESNSIMSDMNNTSNAGTTAANTDQVIFKKISVTDLGAFRTDTLMRVAKIKKIATSAKNDPVSKALNDTNKIVDNLRLAHSTLENGCSTYVIRKMILDGEELEKKCKEFYQIHFHNLADILGLVDKYVFPDSLFYN